MRIVALALVVTCIPLWAAPVPAPVVDDPKGIEVREYTGWRRSVYINATETPVQAVMVPTVGGRIVHFSLNGENILFENSASQGKTLGTSVTPLWMGGYQCDVGPEIRGIPEHTEVALGLHHWKPLGDFAVAVSSTNDPALGVSIEKELVLAPDTGELGLNQRIRNFTDQEKSYCVWDRTVCKNGGYLFFPLNKKSHFKSGWSIRYQGQNGYFYESERPILPQVQIIDGVLVSETRGSITKIGADSDAGWIAYVKGKLLFVKYFPYFPEGNYSDGGNSVELYFDQQVMEFGPLSPEIKLAAGKEYMFPEKWVLIALKKEITSAEEARKLVKKIRPSPFRTRR